MNNACENRVWKRYAELNENDTKNESKLEQEIFEIVENTRNKCISKSMRKKDAERNHEKTQIVSPAVRPGFCFQAGGGGI